MYLPCRLARERGLLQRPQVCTSSDDSPFFWFYSRYHDSQQVIDAASCSVDLGAEGCAVAQPLEAAFKALWPDFSVANQGDTASEASSFSFLDGGHGHGLSENRGFLRSERDHGLSAIAIVLITDGDDCSVADPSFFDADAQTTSASLQERCQSMTSKLQNVRRYVEGLQALRPGNENLVHVFVVGGVPQELVDESMGAPVDFYDEDSRNAFYDGVLADPRMKNRAANAPAEPGGVLEPSCISEGAIAYPPRRLVKFARHMGENAHLISLCSENFGATLASQLNELFLPQERIMDELTVCYPQPQSVDRAGLVDCQVTWELPLEADPGRPLTPTHCDERPKLLSEPPVGQPRRSDNGRVLCNVKQLAVSGTTPSAGEGWYYDYFTPALNKWCRAGITQGISFTPAAQPPVGVTSRIHCTDTVQNAPAHTESPPGTSNTAPSIGDFCDGQPVEGKQSLGEFGVRGDAWCKPAMGTADDNLFCHPQRNVCAHACEVDEQCPAGWVCDMVKLEGEWRGVCADPSCE